MLLLDVIPPVPGGCGISIKVGEGSTGPVRLTAGNQGCRPCQQAAASPGQWRRGSDYVGPAAKSRQPSCRQYAIKVNSDHHWQRPGHIDCASQPRCHPKLDVFLRILLDGWWWNVTVFKHFGIKNNGWKNGSKRGAKMVQNAMAQLQHQERKKEKKGQRPIFPCARSSYKLSRVLIKGITAEEMVTEGPLSIIILDTFNPWKTRRRSIY